ncbi:hypothetical protein MMC13_000792 [Lambiella insularis]|nr:hypothetical protein [Lambiella insularis]
MPATPKKFLTEDNLDKKIKDVKPSIQLIGFPSRIHLAVSPFNVSSETIRNSSSRLTPPVSFSSGKFTKKPDDVYAFSVDPFTGTGNDITSNGCTGGACFKLILEPGKVEFPLCLGYCAPVAGKCKAATLVSSNPEDGYDRSTSDGSAFTSIEEYTGQDTEGNEIKVRFDCRALAGNQAKFVIEQIVQ